MHEIYRGESGGLFKRGERTRTIDIFLTYSLIFFIAFAALMARTVMLILLHFFTLYSLLPTMSPVQGPVIHKNSLPTIICLLLANDANTSLLLLGALCRKCVLKHAALEISLL